MDGLEHGGAVLDTAADGPLRRLGEAEEILREAGIDINDRAFWQGGFDLVKERIDEMEGL